MTSAARVSRSRKRLRWPGGRSMDWRTVLSAARRVREREVGRGEVRGTRTWRAGEERTAAVGERTVGGEGGEGEGGGGGLEAFVRAAEFFGGVPEGEEGDALAAAAADEHPGGEGGPGEEGEEPGGGEEGHRG